MSKNAWSPGRMHAVGEIVRVRIAALAGDGVDRLDVVRAHLVEHLVGLGDDVVLAHAGLQLLVDHLIDAVDHGGGLVEQHDLVDVLDLARIEHHLLAVDELQAFLLQTPTTCRGSTRSMPSGMSATPASFSRPAISLACRLHQPVRGRNGAAHAEHAGAEVLRRQPVAIEPVMHGGRAEVPLDRIVVAGEQREPAQLVALPLADLGAGDVADVVDVEHQQRAEVGFLERLLGAAKPVAVQAAEIDARLEVHVGMPRCRDRPSPVPMRLDGLQRVGLGYDAWLFALRHVATLLLAARYVYSWDRGANVCSGIRNCEQVSAKSRQSIAPEASIL